MTYLQFSLSCERSNFLGNVLCSRRRPLIMFVLNQTWQRPSIIFCFRPKKVTLTKNNVDVKRLFFNNSATFNTLYEHFYNLRLFYFGQVKYCDIKGTHCFSKVSRKYNTASILFVCIDLIHWLNSDKRLTVNKTEAR